MTSSLTLSAIVIGFAAYGLACGLDNLYYHYLLVFGDELDDEGRLNCLVNITGPVNVIVAAVAAVAYYVIVNTFVMT